MMPQEILSDIAVGQGPLVLVNSSHSAQQGFVPALAPIDESDILLERTAAVMLRQALAAIGASGQIILISGYRSLEEQTEIYEQSLREHGADFTKKYVALPGCSEHQTGLAVDLALRADDIDFIRPGFPNEGICAKFRKIAPRYGFVERYGNAKEHLTGIAHEPWHFRFVGFPHAEIMVAHGFCLEEYIDFLKRFEAPRTLEYYNDQYRIDISFTPLGEKENALELSKHDALQISGNNVDGFVLTRWRRAHVAA